MQRCLLSIYGSKPGIKRPFFTLDLTILTLRGPAAYSQYLYHNLIFPNSNTLLPLPHSSVSQRKSSQKGTRKRKGKCNPSSSTSASHQKTPKAEWDTYAKPNAKPNSTISSSPIELCENTLRAAHATLPCIQNRPTAIWHTRTSFLTGTLFISSYFPHRQIS